MDDSILNQDDSILQQVDWHRVLGSDRGVSAAILAHDGEILYCTAGMFAIFGIASERDLVGKRLDEIFQPEFASERYRWIEEVRSSRKPLRVRHVYNGRVLVSTLVPLEADDGQFKVFVLSRLATASDPDGNHQVEAAETEYIDLGPLSVLTPREFEVFVLLGHHHTVPQAAKILHRSPRTIERHKAEIGRKLGASRIGEIVKIVSQLGLTWDHVELKRYQPLRPEYQSGEAGPGRRGGESNPR